LAPAQAQIIRRDLTQADGIVGFAGAVSTVCAATVLFSTSVDAGRGTVDGAGGWAEVMLGWPTVSAASVSYRAVDKCGGTSVISPIVAGADLSPPNIDAGAIVMYRRPVGQLDSVEGLPGAVTDLYNAATRVEIYDPNLFTVLATVPVVGTGFAELPIGTATRSFTNLRFRAFDKCGNYTGALVSGTASNGAQPDAGAIDRNLIIYVDREHPLADGVYAGAGALTQNLTPWVSAQLFDGPAASGSALSATFTIAANGGFAEQSAGPGGRYSVWVEVIDKAGVIQRVKDGRVLLTATVGRPRSGRRHQHAGRDVPLRGRAGSGHCGDGLRRGARGRERGRRRRRCADRRRARRGDRQPRDAVVAARVGAGDRRNDASAAHRVRARV